MDTPTTTTTITSTAPMTRGRAHADAGLEPIKLAVTVSDAPNKARATHGALPEITKPRARRPLTSRKTLTERKLPPGNSWLKDIIIPPTEQYPVEKLLPPGEVSPLEKLAFPDLTEGDESKPSRDYLALRNWIILKTKLNPNEYIGQNKMKEMVKGLFPKQGKRAYVIYGFLLVIGAVHFKLNSPYKYEVLNEAKGAQSRFKIRQSLLSTDDNEERSGDSGGGNGDDSDTEMEILTPHVENHAHQSEKKRKRDDLDSTNGTQETGDIERSVNAVSEAQELRPPPSKRIKALLEEITMYEERIAELKTIVKRESMCLVHGCTDNGWFQCWMCHLLFCRRHYNDRDGCVDGHINESHSSCVSEEKRRGELRIIDYAPIYG